MNRVLQPRIWYLLVAIACVGLLAYALYVQHVDFPCPLCVLQRVAFVWIGSVALLAALHNPAGTGRWVYAGLVLLGCIAGAALSGRHVWLQLQPPGSVPECGMSLNYMLETMPVLQVLDKVLYGSGECAKIDWSFLGLSMPAWTGIWYIGLAAVTLWVLLSHRSNMHASLNRGTIGS